MTSAPKAAKPASSGVGGGASTQLAAAAAAVVASKKNPPPPPAPAAVEEDESVTDLYTTDGTAVSQQHSRTLLLGGGAGAGEGGGAIPLTDEMYREQVRLEQERIFRDYQLELPIVTPPPPHRRAATGGQPTRFFPHGAGRGGAEEDHDDDDDDDDGTQGDEQSLLTYTVAEEEEGDGTARAIPPRDPSGKSKSAPAADADAQSVLTDNPIFRANMEAEERRLMAEFDFDYSVKSSFDDHMDAYYAPPVMAAAGDPAALPVGGCRGSGIPARGGGKGAPATFFAPLAPSVAIDTDLDANSTLPDYSLVEEGGGPHHQVVPLAPGGEDEEHGGVMLGVGVLGTGGHAPGRGGPNPATKSASSSLSSLRSLPFFSTLKVLLPSAISSSSAATRPATATASDAGQRQTKNSTVPRTPSRSGSSTGVSDTSSPTSKTQTPTATDSNGRQNTASNSSPSRKEGFVGGDGGAFGSGGGPTVAIGGVQDKSVPPSIIILGITRGDDYDDADDPTLGGHDPGANDGRTPAPPCSGEREKDGDDDRRRGLVRKTMHRLWSDWLGRVILLLLLAMMLSIGVAVGGLVAYRNRADATGASPSSTGSSTDSSTPGAPASASNSSDLDSADDDFFVAPPANLTAEDATDPPEAEGAIAPSAAPVAETEEPTSTDAPSHVRSTKPPSPAPAPTGEPSPSPVAMPPPPPPGDCQDDPNAIFFVNEQAGDRDCAFLADQPGIRDFLCQGEYDPSRVCPVTCGTCPDSSSSGTTANPTPSPTAAPIPATSEPTTPPTAEATAEATTAFPSPVPTASATAEPSSRSGAVSASLRAIIANVAPPSVLSRLDDGSSAPNQAFSWLERDFEAYGGLEVQVVQRYALATVAYSFQSDQWDDESGWLDSNAAECDWFGVSCDGSNRVTSIDLEQNGLRGTLPPELSLLSGSLSELNVNENSIGGELPTEVGLLRNLETLLMADNNFEGSLPTQVGRMESLTIWHLEKNAMTGSIPSTVENLENLAELSIWGNDFTGSASELCDLDNLQDLIVDCDSSIDCYARCYYQCGGDTGIDCTNRALIGGAIAYESA